MESPGGTSSLTDLLDRVPDLMLSDQGPLRRRIAGARRLRDDRARQRTIAEIGRDIDAALRRVEWRAAGVPPISYPAVLPVSRRKDDILAAIRDHQVVVVAGETGSGKTTQLPKICLEAGRGVYGMIGHTQPRRLAARTVAERIAEELGTELGAAVGYHMRFAERTSERTLVKVMTDGILLAEFQHDRELRRYDTLIIDEAHERSLNVDFLLGYLRRLLPRRPELKLLITSATIDPHRFARHFDGAPVIEVSGRTYPVEVRYRPLVDPDDPDGPDRDQTQAICAAVDELCAEGPGDILVFLSGEREIRDTRDALGTWCPSDVEILPLYARLSVAEQHRVFGAHSGRRVVLATNVAETSLTVPGIRYVIDSGVARVSRYSHRTKVQRLPIEPVSQASANQRAGRCGRVADGVCLRLYTEEDFTARPEFTEPEILRTNLASVILQMMAAGLGDLVNFPFIDPPDRRNVADGVALLRELGALDPAVPYPDTRLTPLGRELARLPVDPRLARMLVAASDDGCLSEVLVIVAALSIQEPRERPVDHQQAADEKHARFADADSDFSAYLMLWSYLRERQGELSGNQFRKLCKAEFLNYARVREWQDLHDQLRQILTSQGRSTNDVPAPPQAVHRSLLAGLLSQIGIRDERKRDFCGARNARFAIAPGSVLARKSPQWVMVAELVETSRLWGRIAGRIDPRWIESLAAHLVRREYTEPRWDRARGSVVATEKVTLYGLPIVTARTVQYGAIDPALCRELFIRHALVAGDWQTRHSFFQENRRLLAEVANLEDRARRRDILVDDEALFDFYDQRVGADVVSARHFDSWWKRAREQQPGLLTFDKSTLVNEHAPAVSEADYPDVWPRPEAVLPLTYQFEPGARVDGVTVHVPLAVLHQVAGTPFEWQIPGLREELVTALIKSLPKQLRRNFVPAPDFARAALARMTPGRGPLLAALEHALRDLGGVEVPRDAWQHDRVPDHLKVTFRVVDEHDRALAEGKDLDILKRRCAEHTRSMLSAAAGDLGRSGLRSWTFGRLPRTCRQRRGDHDVIAYPALVDAGDSVAIQLFETPAHQRAAMWRGTRRLLILNCPSPLKALRARWDNDTKLVFHRNPHGGVAALLDDCLECAVDAVVTDRGGPVWDEAGFGELLDAVRAALPATVSDVVDAVRRVLAASHDVDRALADAGDLADRGFGAALADLRAQVAAVVYPGFVTATGWRRLPDVARYLRAAQRRLEKLPHNVRRDGELMGQVGEVTDAYRRLLAGLPPDERDADEVARIRWMIEELRVSYFAQTLGTAHPVSDKRVYQAIAAVTDGHLPAPTAARP